MAVIEHNLAMKTNRNDQERVLVRRIGQGDHKAFHTLFDRYRSDIYRFCLLLLGDRETANDVYQEIFLAFYQACRKGTVPRNVRNYLLTAARNRSLNYLKINRRYESCDDLSSTFSSPQHENYELQDQLRSALERIPAQYREAFLMAELVGYNYDEIGEILQVDHHTVKNRIYRARLALRKILSPTIQEMNGEDE